MSKYQVIHSEERDLTQCLNVLNYVVDSYLDMGYSLQGGINIIYIKDYGLDEEFLYVATQAVVKI
jgi:hypothetical protein